MHSNTRKLPWRKLFFLFELKILRQYIIKLLIHFHCILMYVIASKFQFLMPDYQMALGISGQVTIGFYQVCIVMAHDFVPALAEWGKLKLP